MKLLIPILCLMTGCTTVYKVDSRGICYAPNGKVVKEADIDPALWMKKIGYGKYARRAFVVTPGCFWGQSSTAYGW